MKNKPSMPVLIAQSEALARVRDSIPLMPINKERGWREQVNDFIQKWCGANAKHLLDSDENDGEKLRQLLSQTERDAYKRCGKVAKQQSNPFNGEEQRDGYTCACIELFDKFTALSKE